MLLYISYVDFDAFYAQGVHRKIRAQLRAMKKGLCNAYYTGWSYPKALLCSEDGIVETEPAVTKRDYVNTLIKWIQKYGVTRVYIRYSRTDVWFIELLKYLSENKIKNVLEITTYPYDIEAAEGTAKQEHFCFDRDICRYVNRIATFSTHREIWGIPCLNLMNGIDIDEHPLSRKEYDGKKIVFIAVSTMQYWHGYERILKGMYLYYQAGGEYDFRLKFVGDGPERAYYEELITRYCLQRHVEFVGRIEIDEKEKLDDQYSLSDIAVGSLGLYKLYKVSEKNEEILPIKLSEYCVRGIPFICGHRDLRFPPGWEFMLSVPNDDEPIDMNRVIDFYKKIVSEGNYKQLMRDYAEKYLTWDKIMEPVVEYFQ